MVGPVITLVIALILPSVLLSVIPFFYPEFGNDPQLEPVIYFFLALYFLALILYLFVLWSDYYLDVWIITNKRLIDIEQKGLFNRHISEMHMRNIQNVSISIRGIVQTLLRFGDIVVETAAQGEFRIRDAPDLYGAKDLILKYSHHAYESNSMMNNDSPKKTPDKAER